MSFPNQPEEVQPTTEQSPAPQPQYAPPGAHYAAPGAQYAPQAAQYAPPGSPQVPMYQARPPVSGLAIATLIVSFFAGLPAVVMGVFALRQIWVRDLRGAGLAWAGIIIGALVCVAQMSFFFLMVMVANNSVV